MLGPAKTSSPPPPPRGPPSPPEPSVAGGRLVAGHALDAQRQAAALGVDLQDLDLDVLAGLDDLTRVLHVVVGQLGDVHQALDAVHDLDERAEGDDLGDLALELVAQVVGVHHPLPRVLLGLLEAQRDALAVAVDVQHLDRHGVADREDLGRVVHVAPGELGDVDQAVDAVQVHERAEVDDVRDVALHDLAGLQAVQDLLADLLALLLQNGAAREHHVVARAVELDDLALDLLVDMNSSRFCTRRMSTSDAGRKPRTPRSMIRPPLTTSMTVPSTGSPDSAAASMRRHAFSKRARFLDSSRRPSWSSLVRTSASTSSPSSTSSAGSTDFRMLQLVGEDDPLALVADVDQDLVLVDPDDLAGTRRRPPRRGRAWRRSWGRSGRRSPAGGRRSPLRAWRLGLGWRSRSRTTAGYTPRGYAAVPVPCSVDASVERPSAATSERPSPGTTTS